MHALGSKYVAIYVSRVILIDEHAYGLTYQLYGKYLVNSYRIHILAMHYSTNQQQNSSSYVL